MSELQNKNNLAVDDDIVAFFDLLARFDFEDKQKEALVLNSGSLVSAPREPELDSN